ncbi:hypothetical protein [Paenibacillus luteus]|uniref:hypothetical protein n=1 Tax=Paenibacillus luteus TaxID=2545753 RepID=UPI0019D5DACF|nr:hypothetical protein [Paenibacillus luteus]
MVIVIENDYLLKAKQILEKTIHNDSSDLIKKLANQMREIESHGLSALNKVLIDNTKVSSRTFLSYLAESNFGIELARYNHPDGHLQYEPEEFNRTDFVLKKNEVYYCIQMKRLSSSERENRRANIVEEIQRRFKQIALDKYCSIQFEEDFSEVDITEFIAFVSSKVMLNEDNIKFYYPTNQHTKAVIKFIDSPERQLRHLTIGVTGDLHMVNVTNEHTSQAFNSMKRAAGVYTWNNSDCMINIIAIEADHYDDIDISEACFGTEVFTYSPDGKRSWYRKSNGFFNHADYKDKISVVVALRRTESDILSSYHKTLFINDKYVHQISKIGEIMVVDAVLTNKDLPID